MCGEMGQLVKADQRDLRAVPAIDRGVQLQVGKFDFTGSRPAPFVAPLVRDTAKPRIEVQALVPQSARIGDFWRRAAEEHRGKSWHPADIAQRLEDQPDGLPTTRGTAINADIGGGSQELGLRSRLRRYRGFGS